ncbi:MAG: hypothetical protein Fur0018_05640 [Anaerolineales bacterium]
MALWQAGSMALDAHAADRPTREVWRCIGDALPLFLDVHPEECLDGIADAVAVLPGDCAAHYAQTCRLLAEKFREGLLTEDDVCSMAVRLVTAPRLSGAMRHLSGLLRAMRVPEMVADDENRTLLMLGLSLLDEPVPRRLRLAAELLTLRSPLRGDETAVILTEHLLKEIACQQPPGATV